MLLNMRPLSMVALTVSVAAATPAAEYSPELLVQLDPSARMASVCGGGAQSGGASMRAKLAIAAEVVGEGAEGIQPLVDGMGTVDFRITTSSAQTQRYFNQGLSFAYGFNHAAATAAFRAARRFDPDCAMCWWGEAMAFGPNINAPLDPAVNAKAVAATSRAQSLASKATPVEQALIAAMTRRYSPEPAADRAMLDEAYADAMLAVAKAYPAHDDVALLAAESAMDTKPWNYWQADKRTPQPRLGEAVQLVETVLARNPEHPQAAHLYIHLMEDGPDPKRAEAAADRLARPLAPSAGHLVHMPAHIYLRLGRWQDSIRVNVAAAKADETYLSASGDRGIVRYGYYPHNVHFLVSSAQMAGDMGTAIREARKLETLLDVETSAKIAWIQAIHAAPFFAAAQFAPPRQILAMAEPDRRLPYAVGMRHYARAVARANLRDQRGFRQEIAQLRSLRETGEFKAMVEQGVPAPDLLLLAESVARGRLDFALGRYEGAVRHYRAAIAIEDKLPYMEPPYWYYPVSQSLGAALYRARRYDEARNAFLATLARSPNNGWALFGLAASERALDQCAREAATRAALDRVWLGDRQWLRMDRL